MITVNKVEIDEKDLEALGWTAPQSKKRWRAKGADEYYTMYSDGVPFGDLDEERSLDGSRYAIGNYYRTKEEAEQARDRQLAKQRIIDYYREHETEAVDWRNTEQSKYYIFYGNFSNEFKLGRLFANQDAGIYTTSEEAAQYVCDNMQDDLKLMLGIK